MTEKNLLLRSRLDKIHYRKEVKLYEKKKRIRRPILIISVLVVIAIVVNAHNLDESVERELNSKGMVSLLTLRGW